MPRGRFISRSFYDNRRLNSLPIECHHLFGGVNVVCADREGRCKGRAKWINQQVFSERDYSDGIVERWLNMLWGAKDDETGLGLIERYKVDGKPYIWIPGFDKHQKGRHKDYEAESHIPPPFATPESAVSIVQASGDKRTIKELREVAKIEDDLKVAGMIKYYEDELGLMLTPTELERLRDFADNYPDGWFEKAVDEVKAKKNIKVPVRYVEKIMENWLKEEKPAETSTDNQGIKVI